MKKIILIIAIVVIIGIVIGCIIYNFTSDEENPINQSEQLDTVSTDNETLSNSNIENTNTDITTENSHNEGVENTMENARIKLTVNGNEIFVRLDDNQASREFLGMLPLNLTFEDFNSTEKIATLPNELSTEGLPFGYTPEVGDFSYYAPWGNISIFYKDFRYSNALYKLGTIESGTEILGNMSGDFEVTIERVN